jgi:Kyakuja-Dileera-Zisupton transposase
LKDEPYLRYRRMFAMDGNNSLKRIRQVGSHAIADHRVFESDYFLSHQYVNIYADEVKRKTPTEDSYDTPETNLPDEGDPTDGPQPGVTVACADNWKASQANELWRMWNIYEETGIFAAACRHGMILWLVDMVRSGELSVI